MPTTRLLPHTARLGPRHEHMPTTCCLRPASCTARLGPRHERMPMTCLRPASCTARLGPRHERTTTAYYSLSPTFSTMPSTLSTFYSEPSTFCLPSPFYLLQSTLYPPLPSTLSPAAYLLPAPRDASGCRRLAVSTPACSDAPCSRPRCNAPLLLPADSDLRVVKAEDLRRRRRRRLTFKG